MLFFNPINGMEVIVAQKITSRDDLIRTKLKYIVNKTRALTITTCVVFRVKSISAIDPGIRVSMDKKSLGRSLYRAKVNSTYVRRENGTDEVF